MMVVGDAVYALVRDPGSARARCELGRAAAAHGDDVTALRNSIVRIENGEAVTEPFDLVRARAMYLALFGPIDGEVRGLKHLMFEPDGPMLQLPPYLLPASQAGVDAYAARANRAGGDPFDFTGVDWLGRGREMSISVGPRSFLDMRAIAAEPCAPGLSRPWRECGGADPADGGGRRRMRLADRDVAGADLGRRTEARPRRGSGRSKAGS